MGTEDQLLNCDPREHGEVTGVGSITMLGGGGSPVGANNIRNRHVDPKKCVIIKLFTSFSISMCICANAVSVSPSMPPSSSTGGTWDEREMPNRSANEI